MTEATDGAATIVKSEATMIVSNPKAEDIFKLVPDFTTANVLQVIGYFIYYISDISILLI